MQIVTWNVNSIRARKERVLAWVAAHKPDVLCLQETKCLPDQFPTAEFEALGYQFTIHGQKTYNGVAIAARAPLADVQPAFHWPDDAQARTLAATVNGIRVHNLYVPNGSEVGSEKYAYKLEWLERLCAWLDAHAAPTDPLLFCGDFNIAPDDRDVPDPEAWREHVLCSTPERARFRNLEAWGLQDALRHLDDRAGQYTWWDYRAGAFPRNNGLRIDLHLVTAPLVARLQNVSIDYDERAGEKPSDHAPVTLSLADA